MKGLPCRNLLVIAAACAALASPSCQSAYGVDPEKDPAHAATVPGIWKAELSSGFSGMGTERFILEFNGEQAWVFASSGAGSMGERQWSRQVTVAEYENFVVQALAARPFSWSDRKSSSNGPVQVLKLVMRVGERARNVLLENPDATERLVFERLRILAGTPESSVQDAAK